MKNSYSETEKFDSLRAGLRIDDVDFQDADTPKRIDRENAYWRRMVDTLEEDIGHDRSLCNRLRIRRRQVLSGQCSHRQASGPPRFALATAAGAAVFIALGAWWSLMPQQQQPGGTGMTRTASLEPMDVDKAEFANNIDFYTWLEQQSDTVADSGGS